MRSRRMAAPASRQDFGLAASWAGIRTLRLADGPDEVHNRAIARLEFAKHAAGLMTVIPAKAGIHLLLRRGGEEWMPDSSFRHDE